MDVLPHEYVGVACHGVPDDWNVDAVRRSPPKFGRTTLVGTKVSTLEYQGSKPTYHKPRSDGELLLLLVRPMTASGCWIAADLGGDIFEVSAFLGVAISVFPKLFVAVLPRYRTQTSMIR